MGEKYTVEDSDQPKVGRWSQPPQGGLPIYLDHLMGERAALGIQVVLFLALTQLITFISGPAQPILLRHFGNEFIWLISGAASFFFILGVTLIPIAGLMSPRKYGQMIWTILRSVNRYIIVLYVAILAITTVGRNLPMVNENLSGLILFGALGYLVVIFASAERSLHP
jgi:hypothetical protein